MQSMTVDSLIPRLNEFRRSGFDIKNKESKYFLEMQRDEKKISNIITAVHNGRSVNTRLLTADVLLRKWGF